MRLLAAYLHAHLSYRHLFTLLFPVMAASHNGATAQQTRFIIEPAVSVADGQTAPFNAVRPGDTVFIRAGSRNKLLIRNFTGDSLNPVCFLNMGGIVDISTSGYYGISIINSRFFRFSGQGELPFTYGIQINQVESGAGLSIGGKSSDFEIDHISIMNCLNSGIFSKTDPVCNQLITRDSFVQINTSFHDNSISHCGNEGIYLGSSFYHGITLNCNGRDTLIFPPVLKGVNIYNNIVSYSGWDGIQVGSAVSKCSIRNNTIIHDSQAEVPNQMSGIIVGGGSSCDCNNNMILNGKGDGIEYHGPGGNKIYNNIIVNPGREYAPSDPGSMKHGIFVSDVSAIQDSSLYIFFNDIINPKSDGIRFQSIRTRNNRISSNLIINPGNYNYYESSNTSFTGQDAFVMIPSPASDIRIKNNFFTTRFSEAGISTVDYIPMPGSPLIRKADPANFSIYYDFKYQNRPTWALSDIGAIQYLGPDTLFTNTGNNPVIFPNPVNSLLTLKFISNHTGTYHIGIFSISGNLIVRQNEEILTPGMQYIRVNVSKLSPGAYAYKIMHDKMYSGGTFIKL